MEEDDLRSCWCGGAGERATAYVAAGWYPKRGVAEWIHLSGTYVVGKCIVMRYSWMTYRRWFGSWAAAKDAAGLPSDPVDSKQRYTDEELETMLQDKAAELDEPVTRPMAVDDILEQYNLTRETTAHYIEAIVHMNQSDTATEIGVSRQTINRYKNAFSKMTSEERLVVITTLAQEHLLSKIKQDE